MTVYTVYTIALLDGYMEWSVIFIYTVYIHIHISQSSPEPKWQRVQLHPICIAWRVPRMRLKNSIIDPTPLIPHPNHSHQIVKWQLNSLSTISAVLLDVCYGYGRPPPPPFPIWGQSILTDRYFIVKIQTNIDDCIIF